MAADGCSAGGAGGGGAVVISAATFVRPSVGPSVPPFVRSFVQSLRNSSAAKRKSTDGRHIMQQQMKSAAGWLPAWLAVRPIHCTHSNDVNSSTPAGYKLLRHD
ncbi:unnamed protein product [Angiostrongylus costaricensis]|uniref:Secreted protein n=1 Tax=Angiostrongylus costaricensis TaxID=334426 RepID=A0A0R3PPY8_ANGCS|nr:unnamed protein product [Angiostrongylus costaricensis]